MSARFRPFVEKSSNLGVFVNTDSIRLVRPVIGGTTIEFDDTHSVTITERTEQVIKQLNLVSSHNTQRT
jgi:hypothetical protein